jgi:hypothetical protein
MTIKQHIEGQAHFQYFRDGELWYKTDSGFLFPVPASDAEGATFNRDDKAMLFMRWIRKWLASLEADKS